MPEVVVTRDNSVMMSYLSKKNPRDVTNDLNVDPTTVKGLLLLQFYLDL